MLDETEGELQRQTDLERLSPCASFEKHDFERNMSDLELKRTRVLEVKLVQANELTNKGIIGKSDPSAVLYNNDLNPIWNEHFEYIVEDPLTQHLTVKFYYDEGLQSAELHGAAHIRLNELEPGKVKDVCNPSRFPPPLIFQSNWDS